MRAITTPRAAFVRHAQRLTRWHALKASTQAANDELAAFDGTPGSVAHRVLLTRVARRRRRELDAHEAALAARKELNDARRTSMDGADRQLHPPGLYVHPD